jgi:hypothetical protein
VTGMKDRLVVYAQGVEYELTLTPDEVGALLGLSGEAVRAQCRQGVLPTMPRQDLPGASWRISTSRLLDELGVPYKLRPAKPIRPESSKGRTAPAESTGG